MIIERPQPIIDQVVSILRQRIRDRDFGPDNRLPSETNLAEELGVSRTTIRTALSTLASEKMILRKQGDGTYVNTRFMDVTTRFGTIWEFTNMIEDRGQKVTIKALHVGRRNATLEESDALEIKPDENVLSIIRLFFADEDPVIYSVNVIPESQMCEDLRPDQVEEPLPIFFKKYCQQQEFTYGISNITATLAVLEIAGKLKVNPRDPILQFVEVFYNENDHPLVYAKNYFNDKKLQLRVARSFE
jgi:DNA-binding GntR family transcriptional regulator